jgi:hypothetical protein
VFLSPLNGTLAEDSIATLRLSKRNAFIILGIRVPSAWIFYTCCSLG